MPNRAFFQRRSAETKFRPPELEKIYRLIFMLSEINRGDLKDYLALRGGTAINLCYNQLPRLSIDIDWVLVRNGDKNKMQTDREHLRQQLPKIAEGAGYTVDVYLKDYALDTFQLRYRNAFGAQDTIKLEINYIAGRVPIDPLESREPYDLFETHPDPIQTLSVHEVYASKIEALIKRHAARDLFDVHQLAKSGLAQISHLRPRTLFSCCVEIPDDFRSKLGANPADLITQNQITNELRPYLRKDAEFDLAKAKQIVGDFCKNLFSLEQGQIDFLDSLFDRHTYYPGLLFPGRDDLSDHPGMKWRLQQLSRKQ
jgi:predicted nucleotidyltransferase component of viral defense system